MGKCYGSDARAESEESQSRAKVAGATNRSSFGSAEFSPAPKTSHSNPPWPPRIAREARAAKACAKVLGLSWHTACAASKDGRTERPAARIKQRAHAHAPEPAHARRCEANGLSRNIVGTARCDARDELRHHVEFQLGQRSEDSRMAGRLAIEPKTL